MDLESVKIERFKSIHDSTWVEIDDITALVGPNEAGKTAFLEALTKLNPVKSSDTYDITQEFPRSFPAQERHKQEDDPDPVVSVKLNITESDIERIDLPNANGIISSENLILRKDYGGNYIWEFDVDEDQFVHSLLDKYRTHPQVEDTLRESTTIQELSRALSETDSETEEIDELREEVSTIHRQDVQNYIASNYFEDLVPQFLYFDDYYIMTDSVVLDDLIRKDESEIKKEEETFIAFINRAGYTLQEIREIDDFEELISDLEHAANELTSQFFSYWSQSADLQIRIRDRTFVDNDREKMRLQIRIYNQRHKNTLPFSQRSRGFKWFFSFLSFFSQIDNPDEVDLVLLLDEPGLNLHARAQYDLLEYINEELSEEHQVLYTTHSPFMLEPSRLHRARMVEDKVETGTDETLGTKITDRIVETGHDALFPLQAALGFDVVQSLAVGPQILVVEGPSDLMYLTAISDIAGQVGLTPLDHRWSPVPVGGTGQIGNFVSIFGSTSLDVGVLIDSDGTSDRILSDIDDRGVIEEDEIFVLGEFAEKSEADIEDLFPEDFFTQLVEDAYDRQITLSDVDEIDLDTIDFGHPRITKQIERFFSIHGINAGNFNHSKPAKQLQQNIEIYADELDTDDLEYFDQVFTELNSLLDE